MPDLTTIKLINLLELLRGVLQLLDAQQYFTKEFGLPLKDIESFTSLDQLCSWLNDPEHGVDKIKNLFDALLRHHHALVAAADGVALYSLQAAHYLNANANVPLYPSTVTHSHWVIAEGTDSLHCLLTDQSERYKRLVVPGLRKAYSYFYAAENQPLAH